MDFNFGKAFAKSQLSAGVNLPLKGNLFVSVKNDDKILVYKHVKSLESLGFKISATKGTANFLKEKPKLKCVVGLTAEATRLIDVRKNRMTALKEEYGTDYNDA